ncbi:type II secretion system F family protein [Ihubacter sp. rT4E-8]|uniref:type II secretion system F family protein n=1 Tax=Ihubacter sp. rT4E-8 TaxID=3242369 RepID=UPI003CE76CDA
MKKILSNEMISSLTLEISLLLHAGIPVGDALSLLSEESEYKELLQGMAQKADEGASLSTCLRESEKFPSYVCGLIDVGEHAGRTEEALKALSYYYERRVRLNRRIRSAFLYPAIMLVLMLIVIGVLLIKVLPIFDDVYASLGGQLTGVGGGLLMLGHWLDRVMPALWILLAVAVIFIAVFAAAGAFRDRVLALWRKHRGDKGIFGKINTSRLIQAFAMGISSGLQAEESLDLAADLLVDIPAARKRCLNCRTLLDEGQTLSMAMQGSSLLPASACRLMELGQRSGAMDTTIEKIADDLADQSEYAIEELVSRIEPALVLICSLLVGLILLSVMLPLMHIMAAIG